MSNLGKLIKFYPPHEIRVRVGNSKGYDIAVAGDGINVGAIGSHNRRGRVQKQMCGTITTQVEWAVILPE